MKNDVYIAYAKRSPIGNLLGSLSSLSAVNLGAAVIKDIISSTKIYPEAVTEVIIGQVLTAGLGQNTARQTAIAANIPISTPAYLVNQVCGSGLQAVYLGARSIASNEHDLVIAGGQESMSNAMHCAYLRRGNKIGSFNLLDSMSYDGLTDVFSGQAMGITAENVANKYNITRQRQDQFAYNSQHKAANSQKLGKFKDEITPIEIQNKKQSIIVSDDEFIRPDTNIESLAKLKPAFLENGSVTAGNSSGINDGAAFLVLASEIGLIDNDLTPMARIVSFAHAGVEPSLMGTGPIPASILALRKAGWKINDLDIIECNEAFAAQSICVTNELGLDPDKVNVNGGAIALGHPIGASGARVLVTLLHEMKRAKLSKGLATLCIGGGMGIAMCVESFW
jgi:acetyl-CoA C-acetyltransferase